MSHTCVCLLGVTVDGEPDSVRADVRMARQPVIYLGTAALYCDASPETLRAIAAAFHLAADVKESHSLAHSLPEVA